MLISELAYQTRHTCAPQVHVEYAYMYVIITTNALACTHTHTHTHTYIAEILIKFHLTCSLTIYPLP